MQDLQLPAARPATAPAQPSGRQLTAQRMGICSQPALASPPSPTPAWARLSWKHRRRFGGVLGPFWRQHRAILPALEAILDHLGAVMWASWHPLGPSWGHMAPFWIARVSRKFETARTPKLVKNATGINRCEPTGGLWRSSWSSLERLRVFFGGHVGAIWGRVGSIVGRLGRFLKHIGLSWGTHYPCGRLLATILEAMLGHQSHIGVHIGPCWGPLGPSLGPLELSQGHLILEPFWVVADRRKPLTLTKRASRNN